MIIEGVNDFLIFPDTEIEQFDHLRVYPFPGFGHERIGCSICRHYFFAVRGNILEFREVDPVEEGYFRDEIESTIPKP